MKDEEFFASKAVGSVVSVVHSGIDSDLSFLNVYRIPKLDSLAHCTFAVVDNLISINL